MYEEKKVKVPFRDIALQILVIVLFVLVLLWLFPTKKNMKKYVDNNGSNNNTEVKNENKNDNTNNNNDNKQNNTQNTNTNTNNDNKNNDTKNNDKKENNNQNNTTAKQYEYSKVSNGTYGEYGPWSDWSAKYVAASDTVDVQTEVRGGMNGTKTTYVKTGTKKETNVVVGTKTYNKIVGYNVRYVRNDIKVDKPITNFDDYVYVLTSAQRSYTCADGTFTNVVKTTPKYDFNSLTYEQLITLNGDLSELNAPSTCANAKLVDEEYNYTLYERIPIYESVTENIYGDELVPVYETKTESSYGTTTYYRYRTRSYQAGTETIKWSNSENDENLIAQGYHFTGNVK